MKVVLTLVLMLYHGKKVVRGLVLCGVMDVCVGVMEDVPFIVLLMTVVPLAETVIKAAVKDATSLIPLIVCVDPCLTHLVRGDLLRVGPNVLRTTRTVKTSA